MLWSLEAICVKGAAVPIREQYVFGRYLGLRLNSGRAGAHGALIPLHSTPLRRATLDLMQLALALPLLSLSLTTPKSTAVVPSCVRAMHRLRPQCSAFLLRFFLH